MAWIELHDDLMDHYKTERLADALGVPKVYAAGHLVSLWLFTLRSAWRDADLSKWGDAGIARAGSWQGDPAKFVKALRECGFLDGGIVHGWMERAGDLVWKRLEREEKRTRGTNGHRAGAERPPNGHRTATEREATVPYPTVHDTTSLKTAPAAVDFTKGPLEAMERRGVLASLADSKLPFAFGERPDRFEKGFPVLDLPAETCKAILEKMPRLSDKLAAQLKEVIAMKTADMTPAQRRQE